MQNSQSPLFWSFPLGSLFDTRIRVSLYFPLLFVVLLIRLDPKLACALTGIFFVSTLLHELIGHVLIARSTGGDGREVLIWPFGGLAWVQPARTFKSQFLTAAGGPAVNLLICLALLPTVLWAERGIGALYPFELPIAGFSEVWGQELLLLTFYVNWMLTLLNLLPIFPLDGGRMVEACLIDHGTATDRRSICLKVGMVISILLTGVGLMVDNVWVVFLASTLLILNVIENANLHMMDFEDESFLGYDFSQGYTSLEKGTEQEVHIERKSFWVRWREQRQARKAEQIAEQERQDAKLLDELLAKVHNQGMDALTAQEKKFLEHTSKNIRTKNG